MTIFFQKVFFHIFKIIDTPFGTLLVVITFYSGIFGMLLPEGVSKNFFNSFFLIASAITFIIFIISIIPLFFNFLFRKKEYLEKYDRQFYWFILLPFCILFAHFWKNKELFSLSQAFYLHLSMAGLCFVLLYMMPKLFERIFDKKTFYFLNLAILITLLLNPSLSKEYGWHNEGNLIVLICVLMGYFLIPLLIDRFLSSLCLLFVSLYIVLTLIFPLVFVKPISFSLENIQSKSENQFITSFENTENFEFRPNIYLLLFESLANNETILNYGYDNTQQSQYLDELGFTIYDGIYSNGTDTLQSVSKMLNLSDQPIKDKVVRWAIAGNGAVHDILRKQQYNFDIISYNGYFTQGLPRSEVGIRSIYPSDTFFFYDFVYAILVGKFKFEYSSPRVPYEDFIAFKRNYFKTIHQLGPTMLLTRSPFPNHSQNSGVCLPGEKETYIRNLQNSNLEMKNDVKQILKNDPNAIIMIFGDHGPYLTKNCNAINHLDPESVNIIDLQDRVGTFLAIYWPKTIPEKYKHNIITLQDTLPAIISNISSDQYKFSDLQSENFSCRIHREICIDNGVIRGGINDNKPLFKKRSYALD